MGKPFAAFRHIDHMGNHRDPGIAGHMCHDTPNERIQQEMAPEPRRGHVEHSEEGAINYHCPPTDLRHAWQQEPSEIHSLKR